jgi:hypothetical protein
VHRPHESQREIWGSAAEGSGIQWTSRGEVLRQSNLKSGEQAQRNLMPSSSTLSRFKDSKAIGVVDEDAPEKSRSQDTIDPLYIRALLGFSAEEGYTGQFE